MNDWWQKLTTSEKLLLKFSAFPKWYDPMLATLTNVRFSDPQWLYECKFDGERALVYYHQSELKIFSRNKQLLNSTYPDLIESLYNQLSKSFIIDGEIVALKDGISNFSKLQERIGLKTINLATARRQPVYYYIFDILFLDDYDLRDLPLKTRKNILKILFDYKDPLRFTEGIIEKGEEFFQIACANGWEGIIAKRADAPYQGKRSRDWLKFKCHMSQELIIIGYTPPKGHRIKFGALLVGYYEQNTLKYAGKVGTGFTRKTLIALKNKMDQHLASLCPLAAPIKQANAVTWLKPFLVGEFDFTQWTKDKKLRHPRFKGLREDKNPKEVFREEPQ